MAPGPHAANVTAFDITCGDAPGRGRVRGAGCQAKAQAGQRAGWDSRRSWGRVSSRWSRSAPGRAQRRGWAAVRVRLRLLVLVLRPPRVLAWVLV